MRKSSKCIRIDVEALKGRIIEIYLDAATASKAMKRSHDYVAGIFRKYAGRVEFPEYYIYEFEQKLGIEWRDLVRKNKPRYKDDQICFDQLEKIKDEEVTEPVDASEETDFLDLARSLVDAINTLTDEIRKMKEWRITIS